MLVKSVVCTNCICLPMCFSKLNSKLISQCAYVSDAINDTCASLKQDEYVSILFETLDRQFLIEKTEEEIVIKDTRFW